MRTPILFKTSFAQLFDELRALQGERDKKLLELIELFATAYKLPTLDDSEWWGQHDFWDNLVDAIADEMTPVAEEHLQSAVNSLTEPSQQGERENLEFLLHNKLPQPKAKKRSTRNRATRSARTTR